MVPDFSKCEVGNKNIRDNKDISKEYLESLLTIVRERGKEVMNARGLSSALSAANGIKDHLKDLYFGTSGEYTSMGIIVDGNLGEEYGITEEVCFSFPVVIDKEGNRTLMKKTG